jgi:hypothetical protein
MSKESPENTAILLDPPHSNSPSNSTAQQLIGIGRGGAMVTMVVPSLVVAETGAAVTYVALSIWNIILAGVFGYNPSKDTLSNGAMNQVYQNLKIAKVTIDDKMEFGVQVSWLNTTEAMKGIFEQMEKGDQTKSIDDIWENIKNSNSLKEAENALQKKNLVKEEAFKEAGIDDDSDPTSQLEQQSANIDRGIG